MSGELEELYSRVRLGGDSVTGEGEKIRNPMGIQPIGVNFWKGEMFAGAYVVELAT